MASVVIEAHRKRFSIKAASPMQKLESLVQDVLDRLQLAETVPEKCTLSHKGAALDLQLPFRFANLPAGAKLELVTGHEPVLGVVETAAPARPPQPMPAAPKPAAPAAPAPARLPQPASLTPTSPGPAAATPAPPQVPSASAAAAPAPAPPAPAAAPAAPPAADAPAAPIPGSDHPSFPLFGRVVHVFTREAELAADSAA